MPPNTSVPEPTFVRLPWPPYFPGIVIASLAVECRGVACNKDNSVCIKRDCRAGLERCVARKHDVCCGRGRKAPRRPSVLYSVWPATKIVAPV